MAFKMNGWSPFTKMTKHTKIPGGKERFGVTRKYQEKSEGEKSKWRKKGNDCWDMGLRLIGKKAFWDPIIFSEWLFNHQITNKPKYVTEREEQTKMIAFIKRNTQNEH